MDIMEIQDANSGGAIIGLREANEAIAEAKKDIVTPYPLWQVWMESLNKRRRNILDRYRATANTG